MLKAKQGEQAPAHGASMGCERAWHFSFPGKSPLHVLFQEKAVPSGKPGSNTPTPESLGLSTLRYM